LECSCGRQAASVHLSFLAWEFSFTLRPELADRLRRRPFDIFNLTRRDTALNDTKHRRRSSLGNPTAVCVSKAAHLPLRNDRIAPSSGKFGSAFVDTLARDPKAAATAACFVSFKRIYSG